MASQFSQQYAYRAQKSLGLVGGSPDYAPIPGFTGPEGTARIYTYSADGRLYAYALPTVVRIFQAEGAQQLQELSLPNIVEIKFSPRGTYLSTWERPVKFEDGSQHKNHRIFSASTGEELIAFSQKSLDSWDVQYTISESHAIRLVSSEIQVYRPAQWDLGITDKLKVEGATAVSLSPGLNPSIAVFVAEKKGAPASIKIYGLQTMTTSPPTCQKNFYKADRATIKWNQLGTQVLLLTQTEVDNSNKSYYGETGMYLLSAAGNFDCRVVLDKEGPIHDFAWSPNSKEFGVVYGYMPAKTTLFDQRVRPLHDFGSSPHNFISFNPQGRLLALAGFGNLAGQMTIFDRRSLTKVSTISAPNTSHCEWSADGRSLLTATLSPRLRVDNGIKIWHCTGVLVHMQDVEELYQASWRPTLIDNVPPFPQGAIPPAPAPSDAMKLLQESNVAKATPLKAAGAYRPPGARGLATPSIFKREDEGGAARTPTNGSGAATPTRSYNRSPVPGSGAVTPVNGHHGHGQHGHQNGGRRHVPGAAPNVPGAGQQHGQQGQHGQQQGDQEKKNRKRNKGKKGGDRDGAEGAKSPDAKGEFEVPEQKPPASAKHEKNAQPLSPVPATNGGSNGRHVTLPPPDLVVNTNDLPTTPGLDSALDPVAKKVRNLNKKLKAIDELKEKAKRGERLEATQLKKMDGEAEIRKELAGLGITA